MKIALCQINPLVGDVSGNLKKILHNIEKAKKLGANLVCFHEMALIGYPPRDLLELPAIVWRCRQAIKEIAAASQGIAVLVGGIDSNPEKIGKPLFNTAFWCEEGRVAAKFHKTLLPNYDVFDETRYFEPGKRFDPWEYKGRRLGITVCEDIWNDTGVLPRQLYSVDPVFTLTQGGVDLIINLSASPYSIGKCEQRKKIVCGIAMRYSVPVVYVNQVGGNDELIFDGGSMAVNTKGELMALADFFKEDLTLVNLDEPNPAVCSIPDEMAMLEKALVLGLHDYVKKCGFKKVALGLSGGIDSALVASLAVRAVGAKNVLGLIMPSRFSSSGSVIDSRKLAKNLGIKTQKISIELLHRAYLQTFRKMFGRKKPDTTEENIQARIRGNLLMAVSNKLGHLVLSTGNKSELAVGYCTLYGDMSGGLAVISDLPKTLVYELARYINRKKEIIPQAIFDKPPSAELKPDQTDQDTLPSYEVLDGIIKAFVEEMKSEEEIVAMGTKPAVVKKVLSMIAHNEYKRRQAAPGLKVTSKAFGMGRRFPIACKL